MQEEKTTLFQHQATSSKSDFEEIAALFSDPTRAIIKVGRARGGTCFAPFFGRVTRGRACPDRGQSKESFDPTPSDNRQSAIDDHHYQSSIAVVIQEQSILEPALS